MKASDTKNVAATRGPRGLAVDPAKTAEEAAATALLAATGSLYPSQLHDWARRVTAGDEPLLQALSMVLAPTGERTDLATLAGRIIRKAAEQLTVRQLHKGPVTIDAANEAFRALLKGDSALIDPANFVARLQRWHSELGEDLRATFSRNLADEIRLTIKPAVRDAGSTSNRRKAAIRWGEMQPEARAFAVHTLSCILGLAKQGGIYRHDTTNIALSTAILAAELVAQGAQRPLPNDAAVALATLDAEIASWKSNARIPDSWRNSVREARTDLAAWARS